MLTPGAAMSGFSRSPSETRVGPCAENPASCGSGVLCLVWLPGSNDAVALAPAWSTYLKSLTPSASEMWIVGIAWKSASRLFADGFDLVALGDAVVGAALADDDLALHLRPVQRLRAAEVGVTRRGAGGGGLRRVDHAGLLDRLARDGGPDDLLTVAQHDRALEAVARGRGDRRHP